jgi:signal peptidase I
MVDLADRDTKHTIWPIIVPIIIILCLFLWFQAVFQSFVVEGFSMEHSLQGGQVILVNKAAYWFGSPKRGDIVVYRSGDKMIIHRIVAMPEEWVKVDDGIVYISDNGTGGWVKLNEPYAQGHSISYGPKLIPEGEYFILGDNRDNTSYEMVPRDSIIGKAWLSIWPLSDWGFAPNYSPEVE